MNTVTEKPLPLEPDTMPKLSLWSDDFDMDLLRLFPELRSMSPAAEAEKLLLYCYGSISRDKKTFSHPSSWNGVGALYFTSPPQVHRDDTSGFVRLNGGLVTSDPLCCISALDAIRDAWCHTLDVRLDWKLWTQAPHYDQLFFPIMSHIRGWQKADNIHRLMFQVRKWTMAVCTRALEIAKENQNSNKRP